MDLEPVSLFFLKDVPAIGIELWKDVADSLETARSSQGFYHSHGLSLPFKRHSPQIPS